MLKIVDEAYILWEVGCGRDFRVADEKDGLIQLNRFGSNYSRITVQRVIMWERTLIKVGRNYYSGAKRAYLMEI